MPCYVWQGRGADNASYAFAFCVAGGSTVGWVIGSQYPTGNYRLPAVNGALAPGADNFYVTADNIIQPNNQVAYSAAISARGLRGNCTGCLFQGDLWDCINGNCVKNSQYNTPGIYQSLEECQSSCGNSSPTCAPPNVCIDPNNYCPPGKVCISQSEWSQIEGLSNQLRNNNCS